MGVNITTYYFIHKMFQYFSSFKSVLLTLMRYNLTFIKTLAVFMVINRRYDIIKAKPWIS